MFSYYDKLPPDSKRIYTDALCPYSGRVLAAARAGHRTVVEGYNAIISILRKEKIQPAEWPQASGGAEKADPILRLQRFWFLARQMGVESIWVLVDGVDEEPSVRTSQAIFDCVAELLLNQQVMEFREQDKQVMCFKVFLTRPDEIKPLLEQERFRKDRILIRNIEWKRKELKSALQRRLAYYSNNSVLSFDDICEPGLRGTQDKLLDECGLRPRTLFLMGREILALFQKDSEPSVAKLDKNSIEEGIRLGKNTAL